MKGKKVLIALDYNPTAQKIAEIGYSMAQAMKAEVILLHVVTDPVYYSSAEYSPIVGFVGYTGSLQLDSKYVLKASQHFLDKLKVHLGDTTIKTLVKEGDFAESIVATAQELHVSMIVLGSHSRRWLEDMLMGSVTEKVLQHATVPILIIPTKQNK
jgi:nucleotide-binding universal stress UspA family protein